MPSFSAILSAALALSPLAAAHMKIPAIQGDAGGNGTGLGIMGAVVAETGPNGKTEKDTTVFTPNKLQQDGMGKTQMGGAVKAADVTTMMALSGSTMPQVMNSLTGTVRSVSSDGCGPVRAVVDPTGTGKFSAGTVAEVTSDIPGTNGNCPKSMSQKRSPMWIRALETMRIISKRATPTNQSFKLNVAIPAGTTCTGTMGGMTGVCMVKIANQAGGQSWGGVVPFQMASAGGNATTSAAAGATTGAAKSNKAGKRRGVEFAA